MNFFFFLFVLCDHKYFGNEADVDDWSQRSSTIYIKNKIYYDGL